jgi:hypothetical protein
MKLSCIALLGSGTFIGGHYLHTQKICRTQALSTTATKVMVTSKSSITTADQLIKPIPWNHSQIAVPGSLTKTAISFTSRILLVFLHVP